MDAFHALPCQWVRALPASGALYWHVLPSLLMRVRVQAGVHACAQVCTGTSADMLTCAEVSMAAPSSEDRKCDGFVQTGVSLRPRGQIRCWAVPGPLKL